MKIDRRIKFLTKKAGLLRVPESIFEPIFAWVSAYYCSQFSDMSNFILQKNNNREATYRAFKKYQNKFNEFYETVDQIVHLDPDDFKATDKYTKVMISKLFDKLKSFTKFNIPEFNLNEQDPITGLAGWVDFNSNYTSFTFELSEKHNLYRLLYVCNFNDYADKYSEIAEFNDNLNMRQVYNILKSHFRTLSSFREELDRFDISYERFNDTTIKNSYALIGYCKKIIGNIPISTNDIIFDMDASYFPFLKDKMPPDSKISIRVFLTSKEGAKKIYNAEAWNGLWYLNKSNPLKSFLGTVYIVMNPREDAKYFTNIEHIKVRLNEIKTTLRHELQHFIQTSIGQLIKKLKSDDSKKEYAGGLPSEKIRDQKFHYSGLLTQPSEDIPKNIIEKYIDEHGVEQEIIRHPLRDIEFYTRLSDEISRFKLFAKHLPVSLHQDYAKAWVKEIFFDDFEKKAKQEFLKINNYDVGRTNIMLLSNMAINYLNKTYMNQGDFFLNLKNYQPLKWDKAVKEFIKAVI